MVPKRSFPSALLCRAQRLAVPAALVGVVLGAVCCGNVILDGASGQGTGGAGGTDGAGGAGGAQGVGDGGVDGGPGCAIALTSSSGGLEHTIQCFAPPAGGCPSQYAAAMYITPDPCTYLTLVDCGPIVENGACCYLVTEQPHPCGS